MNIDNYDLDHKAFEANERKNDKGKNTEKDPTIFITGATVAVQWEDGGLWTHGMIVGPHTNDHRGHLHTLQVMKTGRLIMQTSRHV